ncbi:histidinol-phosphatase [Paenibacillus sp. J2TS4]|uniref:histidinol-phosphatase n=1 Tax=Paenibacillus sp. J2TS4 TaxID=2807194 RepID=UPI001B1D27C4|nr:histidinol-phosphatase [Paenibacillus sp. J2TS4]GIP31207.1 putative histidinol-phosphatase [Paenibacillus sp. J2TS4]
MKFDMHTHHDRCGHAEGSIRDYIESALEAGLNVVGISDHSPYFGREEDHAEPYIAMAKSEFSSYISEVLKLKKEYEDRIEVLLGVESDFFPEHAELYRQIYDQYPFDYIIGSVHQTGGLSIFNRNRWKKLSDVQKIAVKEEYYDLIRQSAQSGMFQILGHIDAMKGFYPEFSDIPTKAVEATLQIIGESGVAIEINTSGKTKACGGWYPSDDVLERALFYGIPVTFGSDAHIPSRIGDEWELVQRKLREIGYKEWVFFRNKQPVTVPL